jgi:two-component system OmpR family response regulator
MVRVLTIEDDDTTAKEICAELTAHGFSVDLVADGRKGFNKALKGNYDAITLDRMLPHMDGLTVVTKLRSAGIDTPILMISALSDVDERVRGLRAGGDDYLTKPFASEEMAARLEVLVRRHSAPTKSNTLRAEDLELDLIRRAARRGDREILLQGTEFKLLEFMMRNSGQVLLRAMIFEAVWGYHFDPYTNLIEVHIGQLRKKIDLPGLPSLIQTVRGSGYRLGSQHAKHSQDAES